MRPWALAGVVGALLCAATPASAHVLKSATTLSPGSLMLALAPIYVARRNRGPLTGLVLAQACVGLVKDWDLVFQVGLGPNVPPYVAGRVEAPLVPDQAGQPGVALGLGAHWGYPSGFPGVDPSTSNMDPGPGMLAFDLLLVVSEGFGHLVLHAGLGYQFILNPDGTGGPLALGTVAVGAQYSFNARVSLLVEAGVNAADLDHLPRYATVGVVFYAL